MCVFHPGLGSVVFVLSFSVTLPNKTPEAIWPAAFSANSSHNSQVPSHERRNFARTQCNRSEIGAANRRSLLKPEPKIFSRATLAGAEPKLECDAMVPLSGQRNKRHSPLYSPPRILVASNFIRCIWHRRILHGLRRTRRCALCNCCIQSNCSGVRLLILGPPLLETKKRRTIILLHCVTRSVPSILLPVTQSTVRDSLVPLQKRVSQRIHPTSHTR